MRRTNWISLAAIGLAALIAVPIVATARHGGPDRAPGPGPAGCGQAERGHRQPPNPMARALHRVMRGLDLDKHQKAQLHVQGLEHRLALARWRLEHFDDLQELADQGAALREAMAPIRQQRRELGEALRDAAEAGDAEKVAELGQAFADLAEQRQHVLDQHQATVDAFGSLLASAPKPRDLLDGIRGVLTDAQRAAFDDKVQVLRQRIERFRHPGPWDAPGPDDGPAPID